MGKGIKMWYVHVPTPHQGYKQYVLNHVLIKEEKEEACLFFLSLYSLLLFLYQIVFRSRLARSWLLVFYQFSTT